MATSTRTQAGITNTTQPLKNRQVLVWLDDSAEEDPGVKEVLTSLFDNVFTFTNPETCLELVESIETETPCLSILVSGKYGQMLVHDRLQPLYQVKNIYVFCFDTVKHGRWAQLCDKVRCVFSEINKIFQCMQYDIQNTVEQHQQQQQQQSDKQESQQRERFTDDNNIFEYLAFNLIIQSPDDGIEDFNNYCQTHREMKEPDPEHVAVENHIKVQKQSIQEWYRSDLFFTNIYSNDLTQLWTLRWFIRHFYRQLINEQDKSIKDKTKFTTNHGTWLSTDELDAMKHRIGEIIIVIELLMTYTNRQTALDHIQNVKHNKHKVLFEINIDRTLHGIIPYGEINNEEILLWFGARYRLIKIEYIDQPDPYWLIGLNLCSTLNLQTSTQNLYEYYFKELTELNNIHYAFGRILMYKGLYIQAEKWLQIDYHYQELAELAIRQCHYEHAKEYLEHLSDDCPNANLLRAYLDILTSNDNYSKARIILLRIFSEATDKLVRARANKAFGFIHLILTKQLDQAYEHFTLGNEVLRKLLPDIHPDIAKSYIGIGYTLYMQGNIVDAKKYFQMAFDIQKQSLIFNHPDFAKSRNGLAHCLSTDKHTVKQALNEFEYALNILLDTFQYNQQHHPEIIATMNDIEKLRKGKELHSRNTLLDYI
ncbi:unnamed protein product [Adineta steineri]|uniref:Uncharacterized protein n=1 Tax=Adineta steineri TaxID=433720 RepID=A0A813QRA2_9BILA|nr:unnamed protein product [Adineta steineri]CAF3687597.1 unnamed protein product [Adineta steineri]